MWEAGRCVWGRVCCVWVLGDEYGVSLGLRIVWGWILCMKERFRRVEAKMKKWASANKHPHRDGISCARKATRYQSNLR